MTTLPSPFGDYVTRIASATTRGELGAIEQEIFGRKSGVLTAQMKELKDLSPEDKRRRGEELNRIRMTLEELLVERGTALDHAAWGGLKDNDALDVTLDLKARERGHHHLIHEFLRRMEDYFGSMGFDVVDGPEIESEEFNFNLLNIPATHPARDAQDTFWIADRPSTVLRTHTSPVQVRYMREHKAPFRMIARGKVYRKDSDATHSPMFHQVEGLMVGPDVSLANMKAVMESAVKALVSPDVEFRWRTGYFPFVEPGLEMDMRWPGDESQSREGKWLEVVGCGMVHPIVLTNGGVDAEKFQGFAFGFGVERLLMIKHQIPDLRLFYTGELKFLRQF